MSEVDDQQMRETLVSAYRQVVDMGLTDQASGNLSCRVAEGMLISCSGATAKNLTADRVVKVRNDGSWDGEVKPSSEWRMHQAIYQRHEKANAVVVKARARIKVPMVFFGFILFYLICWDAELQTPIQNGTGFLYLIFHKY